MKLCILFQTDRYLTRSTRVFFGVFDSPDLAMQHAINENLISIDDDADIEICECELNEFGEI